jgi:hypothetical protein
MVLFVLLEEQSNTRDMAGFAVRLVLSHVESSAVNNWSRLGGVN